jgi:hypothetical protein
MMHKKEKNKQFLKRGFFRAVTSHMKSISAHPSDEEEDFVQETPEVALVATQAYLLTTQYEASGW